MKHLVFPVVFIIYQFKTVVCLHGLSNQTAAPKEGLDRLAPRTPSALPELIQVKIRSQENLYGDVIAHRHLPSYHVDRSKKTAILFGGYPNNDSMIPFKRLAHVLLQRDFGDIFEFTLDQHSHSVDFFDALNLAGSFGKYIANLLNKLDLDYSQCYFIGHCLGTEIGASTIRFLYELKKDKIGRFTIFDAYYRNTSQIFDLDHAVDFLDAYHAGIYEPVTPPFGNVDFYPNAGVNQPPCKSLFGVDRDQCDHTSTIYYFIESMDKEIKAIETTYDPEKKYLLVKNNPKFATFGYMVDRTERGSFYLPTNVEKPYLLSFF